MKKYFVFGMMILFLTTSVSSSLNTDLGELNYDLFSDEVKIKNNKKIDDFYSSSLFFTENNGQFPDEVLFQTHVQGASVYLCKDNIVTIFTQDIKDNQIIEQDNNPTYRNRKRLTEPRHLEMISIVAKFVDANPDTIVIGKHQLSHKNNYFSEQKVSIKSF